MVRKLWRGKIVCFEVTFEGVKWWRHFNGGRYMIPDLRSSRGESMTSEIGFYPGHLEERLTGGTQRTTGLMVRYEVVKVSRLLSRKDLVVQSLYVRMATLKFIRLWIGSQWRLERSWDVGTERGERVIVLAKAFSTIWSLWRLDTEVPYNTEFE